MKSSVGTLPRGLTVTCLLIITIWGLSEARSFLIPISISAILAFTMMPLVRLMRQYRFPEWSAIGVSSLLLLLPFLMVVSVLIWQGQALIRDFPTIMNGINRLLSGFFESEFAKKLHVSAETNLLALIQRFEGHAGQGLQFLIAGLGAVVGVGSDFLLILLFAVLMLANRKHLRICGEGILKHSFKVEDPYILDQVTALIEKFLVARLLIVLIVAGVDTALLIGFRVQYAFLLGSFLGITTLIPAIGFVIGVIPALILSLVIGNSGFQTLGLFLSLLAISAIEGNLLTPKMVGARLNINALSTFVGLFAGGLLWGIWGMFLSIPVLGILRITFNEASSLQPWGELLADKRERIGISLTSGANQKPSREKVA